VHSAHLHINKIKRVRKPTRAPAANSKGFSTPADCAQQVECDLGRSFPRNYEHEFRLDAGNQIKVPITMQKWHAANNCVRCYQAIVRGTWSYARPSASRVQVRCAARGLSGIGRYDHWQLAKHPIPAGESLRAGCTL
jgi:hypothetical protein